MDVVNYSIPKNNIEIWSLTNSSPIAHPFHIHDVQFYITEVNGAAPPANMTGKKDVVLVPAQQTIKFITKFESFCDSMTSYMYHCHMLTHEDDGMMGQFRVTCPASTSVLEDRRNAQAVIYPNPASEAVRIITDGNEKIIQIIVTDHTGRIVLRRDKIEADRITIDVASYSAGIYSAEIRTNNGVVRKKMSVVR